MPDSVGGVCFTADERLRQCASVGYTLTYFAHHPDEPFSFVGELALADHAHLLIEALGIRFAATK